MQQCLFPNCLPTSFSNWMHTHHQIIYTPHRRQFTKIIFSRCPVKYPSKICHHVNYTNELHAVVWLVPNRKLLQNWPHLVLFRMISSPSLTGHYQSEYTIPHLRVYSLLISESQCTNEVPSQITFVQSVNWIETPKATHFT